MSRVNASLLVAILVCSFAGGAFAAEREFELDSRYLNFPVDDDAPDCLVSLKVDGRKVREFTINLAPGEPDFWVYLELREFAGKRGMLRAQEYRRDKQYDVPREGRDIITHHTDELSGGPFRGFEAVYQADSFPGQEGVYKEELRPQFHFSSKRGWLNDPNGLVYYDGEYHLFYQHNPYGWNHGNMTWGHAVSSDLVRWEELGDAVHPDEFGSIFSGSGVVDWKNTTGFQTGDDPPLVLIYTSAGGENAWSEGVPYTQGISYSNDRGRTWTKYEGNPVQGHINMENRDPKVIWWEETNEWVIVLYLIEDRMAFFTSLDLKRWELQSILRFSSECPELFQLAVDGNEDNKKWILYEGSGDYLIGDFDGREFTPETGKIHYNDGVLEGASQNFSNIPKADGRQIQMSWAKIEMPGMPFNQMMNFPVALTLHSTDEGLRMFPYPVKEIEKLHGRKHEWRDEDLRPGDNPLEDVRGNFFDIVAEIELGDADEVGFEINGFPVSYKVDEQRLVAGRDEEVREREEEEGKEGRHDGDAPLAPVDGRVRLRILVDRMSVETFANDGRIYMPMPAHRDLSNDSVKVYAKGGTARIKDLTIYEMRSIWH